MKIAYRTNVEEVSPQSYLALAKKCGFTPPTNNEVLAKKGLLHTEFRVFAYFQGALIGYILTISNLYPMVFITDMGVDPEYRKQGIGKNLLN